MEGAGLEPEDNEGGRPPRYRNICFTINADARHLLRLLDFGHPTWSHVKYCIYQREMEAHEHFQGYMEFTDQLSFAQIHKMEGLEGGHFERRFGSAKQARHYCMKPVVNCACDHCVKELRRPTKLEGPWEFGEMSHQGLDTALRDVQLDVKRGKRMRDVWEDDYATMVRFHKGIYEGARICTPKRKNFTQVIVILGYSGSGKSALADQMCPDAYWKPAGKWWNDYDRDDVIWDEFSGASSSYRDLLRVFDWTPLALETKGGYVQFTARLLIITTNYHPSEWYHEDVYLNSTCDCYEDSPLARRLREHGEIIDLTPNRAKGPAKKRAVREPAVQPFAVYVSEYAGPIPHQRKLGTEVTMTVERVEREIFGSVENPNRDREHPGDRYGLPRLDGG